MKDRKLKQLMYELQADCQPKQEWVKNTRRVLLAEMPEQTSQSGLFWYRLADNFVPQRLVLSPNAVFSLVIALFMITSFASVNASRNSLPGDALYPVKITAESLKYNLSSGADRAKMAMSMVESRASELKSIISLNKEQKNEQQTTMVVSNLKSSLTLMKDNVKAMQEKENNESALAAAKEIDGKLNIIKEDIKNSGELEVAGDLKDQLAQVSVDVEEISKVVLAVLIEGEKNEEEIKNEEKNQISNSTSTTETVVSEQPVENNSSTTETILDLLQEKIETNKEEFGVRIGE
jgi:hypothetical protein